MHNNLQHKDEIVQLLKSYRTNDNLVDSLKELTLALLIAPVATGRNTIIKELVKLGGYHAVVSDTTRLMRVNNGVAEANGVEYWFKTEEQVCQELKKGNYLGPAIIHEQQVSGIHVSEIQKALKDLRVAITDMDIQGAEEIKELKNDVINIFLLPPTFDEWMRRLNTRGVMDEDEKSRRLHSAIHEIEEVLLRQDIIICINDGLEDTIKEVDQYIRTKKLSSNPSLSRKHAANLLARLKSAVF